MKKNYLLYAFVLTAIVVFVLFGGYFFTPVTIFGYTVKKIDIFSDIRPDEKKIVIPVTNTVPSDIAGVSGATVEACPKDITCIEEYASDHSAMRHFYEMLDSIHLLKRPVRIGFYGDSFIEGDILVSDIREQLQQVYGGCGVGYVPIISGTAGFRRTVIHGFQNITSSSLLNSSSDLGISGYAFKTNQGAGVSYKGVDKPGLNEFSVARLLYRGQKYLYSSYSVNKKGVVPIKLDTTPGIHCVDIRDSIRSIAFSFSPGMTLYGVYLDGDKGIAIDNFSVRGHSGLNLKNIPLSNLRQTDRLLHYDLIVLQYGLNAGGLTTTNYEGYKKGMLSNIRHIREAFPDASIILFSVGDRNTRKQGEFVTADGILNLLPIQQEMAAESQIAFWNVFEAMGGENSMAKFVSAQPPLASKDYTHLSFDGGKVIATQFVNALLYGKKKYDEAKKNGRSGNKSSREYDRK